MLGGGRRLRRSGASTRGWTGWEGCHASRQVAGQLPRAMHSKIRGCAGWVRCPSSIRVAGRAHGTAAADRPAWLLAVLTAVSSRMRQHRHQGSINAYWFACHLPAPQLGEDKPFLEMLPDVIRSYGMSMMYGEERQLLGSEDRVAEPADERAAVAFPLLGGCVSACRARFPLWGMLARARPDADPAASRGAARLHAAGHTHTSQSLPRMLTLWFDFGTFLQAFRANKVGGPVVLSSNPAQLAFGLHVV